MEGEFFLTVQNLMKCKLGGRGEASCMLGVQEKAICAWYNGNTFQLQLSCGEV